MATLKKIIEKIKSAYNGHDDLDEIVADLSGGDFIDHWAKKFCDEDFGHNKELAKELFEIYANKCESSSDFSSLAIDILSEFTINDKDWAKELFKKAIELGEYDASELSLIAYHIADSNTINDKDWAKELFKKAIELAEDDMIELKPIADNIASSNILNDKDWAKELYQTIADNLNELAEYDNLIYSVRRYLEDTNWAKDLVVQAKDALLNADDKFEFAGHSSQIIALAENISDSDLLDDKVSAKEVFEILKEYEGVTDLLDAARKVKEIYEDESEYVEEYMNECLEKAIENVQEGYYCDIYNFIKDDLEDEDRADEWKDNYIDEMKHDHEEYGSCEELFGERENDIDLDDIDFNDYDDKRNIVAIGISNITYTKVEEMFDEDGNLPEEAYELMNESVDEFIDIIKDKFDNHVEEIVYIDIDGNLKEYNSDIDNNVKELEDMALYIIFTKEIPADTMNAILLDMSMSDYGFYATFKNGSEIISQGYDCGEYDSGYFSNDQDNFYINNLNTYAKLYPDAQKLLEN